MQDNTFIIPSKSQISSDLGKEVAILELNSGVYYGLNEVGARIWQLIQEPPCKTVGDLQAAILKEYDVEPACCANDLAKLLAKLQEVGLIEKMDEENH